MNPTRLSTAALLLAISAAACAPAEVSEEEIASTTQAFSQNVGATVAIAAPMSNPNTMSADAGGEQELEGSFAASSGSMVTDPSCVSWQAVGLTLVVTFDACALAVNGAPIDGEVTLGASVSPIGVYVDFGAISIGDASVGGSLGVYLTGQYPNLSAQVQADIALANAATQSSVDVQNLTVDVEGSGVSANGSAAIDTPSASVSGSFSSVHWDYGKCHPVSGTLDFESEGGAPVAVTFLPTTWQDGIVSVQIDGGPAQAMKVLAPCQ